MYRLCARKASSSAVDGTGHPDVGVDSTCSSVLTVDTAWVVVSAGDGELVGAAVGDDVVGDDVGVAVGDDVVGEAVGTLEGDEVVGLFVGGSGVVVVVVDPRGGHHSQIMRYVLEHRASLSLYGCVS